MGVMYLMDDVYFSLLWTELGRSGLRGRVLGMRDGRTIRAVNGISAT